MKREIKFKAWIPKLKIWLEEISISTADNVLGVCADYLEETIKGRFIIIDDEIYLPNDYPEEDSRERVMSLLCGEEYYWIEAGEFELVGFTGIKDKLHNEIYEGDIVSDEKTIFTVEYNTQNSGFWIVAQKTISNEPFVLMTLNSNTVGNGYFDRKDLEVVGNIYENPELLK